MTPAGRGAHLKYPPGLSLCYISRFRLNSLLISPLAERLMTGNSDLTRARWYGGAVKISGNDFETFDWLYARRTGLPVEKFR